MVGDMQFNRKELIMPSGYVMPYAVPARQAPHHPGLALRARVWMRNLELDAALAGGANRTQSDELALRANQLAERRRRRELSAVITHLVAIADRNNRAAIVTPYPPFRPRQVQANRSLLLELAERLRGQNPPALRGLAMTSLMLEDGRGSLTTNSDPATLERAVRACLSALDA
jgi:hypothetical protein